MMSLNTYAQPIFQETRQAKIKKKKADDMTKDSIGIVELGKDVVMKFARIKGFKTPEKGFGYLAYQLEKALPDTTKKVKKAPVVDSAKANIDMLVKLADSVIRKSVESISAENLTKEEMIGAANKAVKEIIKKAKDEAVVEETAMKDADGDDASGAGASAEGTDLVVRRLSDGKEKTFKLVSDYVLKGATCEAAAQSDLITGDGIGKSSYGCRRCKILYDTPEGCRGPRYRCTCDVVIILE